MDMAPPRPPPELNDDVTVEILIRVAPDEPASLFRASAVCKLWHRIILSDPGFCRRYRSFHRGAPLLGFFYSLDFPGRFSGLDVPEPRSRFVATTAASPLPPAAAAQDDYRRVSLALDCRHGRVLFQKAGIRECLAVWDPIADDWTDLPPLFRYSSYSAVVLCDVAGCDHRDCRGGRFLVVCVGLRDLYAVDAYVYSSEDRAWHAPVSIGWLFDISRPDLNHLNGSRPALIGDGIYCTFNYGDRILKYDLVQGSFSLIRMPCKYSGQPQPVLMQNDDGSLGLAGLRGSKLYLWSMNPEEGDAAGWVQRRVIELQKLLPLDSTNCIEANVIGFAEGVGVFFIKTSVGVFTFDLKSRRVMKVSKPNKKYRIAMPFISFFTPDCAS